MQTVRALPILEREVIIYLFMQSAIHQIPSLATESGTGDKCDT